MLAGRSFADGNRGRSPLPMFPWDGGVLCCVGAGSLLIWLLLGQDRLCQGFNWFQLHNMFPRCIILFLSGFWMLLWHSQNLNDKRLVKSHSEQATGAGGG